MMQLDLSSFIALFFGGLLTIFVYQRRNRLHGCGFFHLSVERFIECFYAVFTSSWLFRGRRVNQPLRGGGNWYVLTERENQLSFEPLNKVKEEIKRAKANGAFEFSVKTFDGIEKVLELPALNALYTKAMRFLEDFWVADPLGNQVKAVDVIKRWTKWRNELNRFETDGNGELIQRPRGDNKVLLRELVSGEWKHATVEKVRHLNAFGKFLKERIQLTTRSGTKKVTFEELQNLCTSGGIELKNVVTQKWEALTGKKLEAINQQFPRVCLDGKWQVATEELLEKHKKKASHAEAVQQPAVRSSDHSYTPSAGIIFSSDRGDNQGQPEAGADGESRSQDSKGSGQETAPGDVKGPPKGSDEPAHKTSKSVKDEPDPRLGAFRRYFPRRLPDGGCQLSGFF